MQLTVVLAILMVLWAGQGAVVPADESGFSLPELTCSRTLALLAGSILLMWSALRFVAGAVFRKLSRHDQTLARLSRLPSRVELFMRIAVLGLFGTQLTLGGWARLVCVDWGLSRWVFVDDLLLILPFFIVETLKWHSFYPVNRLVRETVMLGQLAEGLATRPVWTRRQYLSFHLRHGMLIVLVPMLLIIAFKDAVELVAGRWFAVTSDSSAANPNITVELVTLAGAGLIFLLAPLLLRHIWITRPLPAGPLRRRLEEFCRRLKLRYRDILLWDTYSAVANAAVMGLLRPLRFVLLSDALIENMSDEQLEAVFGHEAGHVKHQHIMFLVLFVAGVGSVVFLLVELLALALNTGLAHRYQLTDWSQWILSGWSLVLLIGWVLLFGWVSRRFERQADVHGAWAIGGDNQQPVGNDEQPAAVGDDRRSIGDSNDGRSGFDRLSERGAAIMAAALVRIALLNGISMAHRSWRHSSLNSRVTFLRRLAYEQGALRRFGSVVWLTKFMILTAVTVGGLGWWMLLRYAGE